MQFRQSRYHAWILLGIHLLLPLATKAATLRVTPGPFESGKAFVSCLFDRAKITCFLDTGSAMTLLASERHFGAYPNLGNFHFKSASGAAAEAETIQLATARIDSTTFSNIKVGRFAEGGDGESILGIDLLGRQPFAVNFLQNPSLRLDPRRPSQLFHDLEQHPHGLLSIPIAFDSAKTRALWDTGSGITAVDERYVVAHPEIFRRAPGFMRGIDGAGHPVRLQSYRAKKITIGRRTFRDVPVVATDLTLLGQNLSTNLQAVIGFNLIRKADWFFDPQKNLWSID